MSTLATGPRVRSVRAWSESLGDEAVELAASAGLVLDEWQADVLRDMLALDERGHWAHFEVGVNVPRQNGKGAILEARELAGLFLTGEKLLAHSAHEFATSREHFSRLVGLVSETPELHSQVKRIGGYRMSHGEESINLVTGSRIVFKTRTKSGFRGFAGVDLLILDEAMVLNEASYSAMMPTLRASKSSHGPQLIYTGSAVDQDVHEHGIVWTRVRQRGLAQARDLAYLEWSVDADHPDEVTDEMADDHEVWRRCNPSLGIRIPEEHMERERASMAHRAFCVELLGAGDWPATDGSVDVLISPEQWAAVEDGDSVLEDPVCVAFDVSPDRKTSIAAAGFNDKGKLHVEVIHARAGTSWVAERVAELYQRHEVEEIVCDGFGPSAAIASKVDEAGITVRRINSGEYAQACGVFLDAVCEQNLRHIGQDELNAAVRGARVRPLVDRWAWSRTKSVADVGPLIASTLALWAASEKDLGAPAIY